MNYKLENRIPGLFTDFENTKDFPWLFPDLVERPFFPDFSLTVTILILKHDDDGDGSEDDNNIDHFKFLSLTNDIVSQMLLKMVLTNSVKVNRRWSKVEIKWTLKKVISWIYF